MAAGSLRPLRGPSLTAHAACPGHAKRAVPGPEPLAGHRLTASHALYCQGWALPGTCTEQTGRSPQIRGTHVTGFISCSLIFQMLLSLSPPRMPRIWATFPCTRRAAKPTKGAEYGTSDGLKGSDVGHTPLHGQRSVNRVLQYHVPSSSASTSVLAALLCRFATPSCLRSALSCSPLTHWPARANILKADIPVSTPNPQGAHM